MSRKVLVSLVFAIVACGVLHAEQLTTVAVFDMDRVLLSFYQDSGLLREYRAAEEQYRQQLATAEADLQSLRSQRATYVERGDTTRARRLADEIVAQEEYKLDLQDRWYQMQDELLADLRDDVFFQRLYDIVGFVGENNGYTLVIDRSQSSLGLFWYSDAIDITDEVVTELLARFR